MDRPYVHINVAATADGKIDTFERRGAAISSARDKERVDQLRAEADAVMVGGHTLHDEDPKLTVKSESLRAERLARGLPANPAKVGVSARLHLKPDLNFLNAGPAQIFLFTTSQTDEAQLTLLRSCGAEVFVHEGERVNLISMLETLKKKRHPSSDGRRRRDAELRVDATGPCGRTDNLCRADDLRRRVGSGDGGRFGSGKKRCDSAQAR